MPRSNVSLVKGVISTSLTDDQINVWIEVANAILNLKVVCIGATETILTLIETQLTAHFISILNPGGEGQIVIKEKAEELETFFSASKNILGSLDTTTYGIAANSMSGGCLGAFDKPKASVQFF